MSTQPQEPREVNFAPLDVELCFACSGWAPRLGHDAGAGGSDWGQAADREPAGSRHAGRDALDRFG